MRFDRSQALRTTLVVTLLVYGSSGAPIPSRIGLAEIVTGILLCGLAVLAILGRYQGPSRPSRFVALASLSWLILVPTMTWATSTSSLQDYLRDFFPLFFLAIPLILQRDVERNAVAWIAALHWGLFCTGTLLAGRYLLLARESAFVSVFSDGSVPLNQCPSVIYTAIIGICLALLPRQSVLVRILHGFGGIMCFSTLMMGVMRAQIVIVIFAVFVVLTRYGSLKSFIAGAVSSGVLALGAGALDLNVPPALSNAFEWTVEMVRMKTDVSGLANARDEELATVLGLAGRSVLVFLFGEGWGASHYFATAGGVARFTHNGFLFLLWKAGVLGLVAAALYLIAVTFQRPVLSRTREIYKSNDLRFAHLVSCFSALLIFGVVEMGYKMLTFGVTFILVQALYSLAIGPSARKWASGGTNVFATKVGVFRQ